MKHGVFQIASLCRESKHNNNIQLVSNSVFENKMLEDMADSFSLQPTTPVVYMKCIQSIRGYTHFRANNFFSSRIMIIDDNYLGY